MVTYFGSTKEMKKNWSPKRYTCDENTPQHSGEISGVNEMYFYRSFEVEYVDIRVPEYNVQCKSNC